MGPLETGGLPDLFAQRLPMYSLCTVYGRERERTHCRLPNTLPRVGGRPSHAGLKVGGEHIAALISVTAMVDGNGYSTLL